MIRKIFNSMNWCGSVVSLTITIQNYRKLAVLTSYIFTPRERANYIPDNDGNSGYLERTNWAIDVTLSGYYSHCISLKGGRRKGLV